MYPQVWLIGNINLSAPLIFPDHGTSPPAAIYETYYVTAHKAPCRTASFSQNGRLSLF